MAHHARQRGFAASRFVQISSRAAQAAILAAMLAVLVGCVGSAEQNPLEIETGPDAEITHDGLVRARGSAFEGVWVKPDASIADYSSLLIGDVRMTYKRQPRGNRRSGNDRNFAITQSQADQLERLLRETLEEQIEASERWSVATERAHDVLLIEPFLLDLVSHVPNATQPSQTTFTTSTGSVTLVLELRDSMTEEILARVADRREARVPGAGSQQLSWSNPVSNTAAVRQIFRRWSRIFMARLDTAARVDAERAAMKEGAPADAG